jgi:hypothetical protein
VMLPLFFWFGLSTSLSTLRVLGHIMTTNWKQLVQQPFYSKIVYFLASNATPSTLRLGRTPRSSGPGLLISQTRKIKAASLLQIPAFEELLSLVLNYFWTILWKIFKMQGLGSHNSN